MMKRVCLCLVAATAAVNASPLLVWKNGEQSASTSHVSENVEVSDVIGSVFRDGERDKSSLAGVVFLLGRSQDGTETFSNLASKGDLPGVASKYNDAHSIHHFVSGVDHASTLAKHVQRSKTQLKTVEVSLNDFSRKLTHLSGEVEENSSSKSARKLTKAIAEADVVFVKVPAETKAAVIDETVVRAIEHKSIKNVVVTATRSHDEVKLDRASYNNRRLQKQQQAGAHLMSKSQGRRRLEDQGENADNADYSAQDMTGIYYVNMTPNILAGLMFFFLFCCVTWIAVSCMDMIVGQDVYVNKMPTIGREA